MSTSLAMTNLDSKSQTPGTTVENSQSKKNRDVISILQEGAQRRLFAERAVEETIAKKIYRDKSAEAKKGRLRMLVRAVYGEFMASFLFYTPIFCVLVNAYKSNWTAGETSLATSLVAGLQAVGVSFAFSSVSGAQFNSAVSFALWLTGKLSNRRCALYIAVQYFASLLGASIAVCIFHGDVTDAMKSVAVTPGNGANLGKVFATEFFLTFMLTYTAFTVAFEEAERSKKDSMSLKTISDSKGLTLYTSTPQSKTGFAPFSIGFAIFALGLIGGTGGGAFNPGRMFGPAVLTGKWDFFWLYWLGEYAGAAVAGLLVVNLHKFGLQAKRVEEATVESALEQVLNDPRLQETMVAAAVAEAATAAAAESDTNGVAVNPINDAGADPTADV